MAGGVVSDIKGELTSSQDDKIASTNLAEIANTELSKPVDPVLVDGWSQLRYVDVDFCGLPGSLSTSFFCLPVVLKISGF